MGYRDKTYLGYTDSQGFSGVASIDNVSGQIVKKRLKLTKNDVDDHSAPCVDIMPDGRIISAYPTGHNYDNFMHVRISSKFESVEEFDEDIIIEANNTTTYSQLFYKNNTWWLFFRVGNLDWAYVSSADGVNWTQPTTIIVGGMQYYVKVVETTDSDLLRLVMYSNPNKADTNIRLGFFDTTTSELKLEDGTVLGTSDISKNSFPIILPVETNKNQRLLDVAITDINTTLITYCVFTDHTDGIYKVAHYINGVLTTSSVNPVGGVFYKASVYVGGAVWGENNQTVYLSRYLNWEWVIEKYTTTDQVTYTLAETIRTIVNGVGIRPIFEVNGDKLIWQEGYYNVSSFKDFNTDLKFKTIPV